MFHSKRTKQIPCLLNLFGHEYFADLLNFFKMQNRLYNFMKLLA